MRVSQRVRRPHLQHEARILRTLEGHPAIPRIFAYGHLQHFEYLAMELLGRRLRPKMEWIRGWWRKLRCTWLVIITSQCKSMSKLLKAFRTPVHPFAWSDTS